MAGQDVTTIRTIALTSHSGAGKTSLAECLLYSSGATKRMGRVEDGTTVSDYNPDEIERKISINTSLLHLNWKEHKIYIADTPGYADFVGEVISSLRAADGAVLLVDGTSGVEVGTERAWGFLDERELPRILFVNKMDKENANFSATLSSIQGRFGKKCLPLQFPITKGSSLEGVINLIKTNDLQNVEEKFRTKANELRESLIEGIAETDDRLLEKYLEGTELNEEEIQKSLKTAVIDGKLFPVLCGSATAEATVKGLLDAIVDYLPSPADRPAMVGINPKTGEALKRESAASAPFSAQVFKTISDPYVGQLTLFRVFSGTVSSDTSFYNSTRDGKERIGQIYLLQGKEQQPVAQVASGEIASVAKLKYTLTGDTLCDERDLIQFGPIKFPEPAISIAVKPKSRSDEEKISESLGKLANEDLTFRVMRDQQTKELIISGTGDLHLEVMVNRLKKRFGVEVDIGTPKVAYKETVTKSAKVQGKYKRQSGGRGQYGDVWLEVEPLPRGGEFEFVNDIVGGVVPRQYIPAVEKGVKQALSEGILAGCQLTDVRVTIYDGSYHPVDSSDIAFQIAGAMALRKAVLEANPIILEPVMEVEVMIPEEYMGSITGDLNQRRGRIMGIEPKSNLQLVKAHVPLAEMLKYATELRSMTGGRGSYTMRFSHYESVPHKIAETIIAQANKKKEGEVK